LKSRHGRDVDRGTESVALLGTLEKLQVPTREELENLVRNGAAEQKIVIKEVRDPGKYPGILLVYGEQ